MNLRRFQVAPRIRWASSFALFWGAVLFGCERENSANVDRNLPPETFVTQGPEVSLDPDNPSTIFYRAHLFWRGEDEDGTIAGYRFAVDDTLAPDAWTFTTRTDSVFRFSAGEVGALEHLFLIRAVDNEGKQDPTPDTLRFEAFTRAAPVVEFDVNKMSWTAADGTVNTGFGDGDTVLVNSDITFVWSGSDEDGEVASWTSAFGSSGLVEHERDDTSRTVFDLPSGTHEFQVRAIDDAGAVSTTGGFFTAFSNFDPRTTVTFPINATLSRPWLTGADTLLQMSIMPGDTVPFGATLDFCWTATDPDGPIVSYFWEFDLFSAETEDLCVDLASVTIGGTDTTLTADFTSLTLPTVLAVRGRDVYGNTEGRPEQHPLFVNYQPTVSIDPVGDVPVNTTFRFSFSGDDLDGDPDDLLYRWRVDSEPTQGPAVFDPDSLFIDAFFTEIGSHELRVWARDVGGFESESEPALLTFSVVPAPAAEPAVGEKHHDPADASRRRAGDLRGPSAVQTRRGGS